MLFRLKNIAAHFNYYPNYISSLLHRETGRKFTEILLEKRMERAVLFHIPDDFRNIPPFDIPHLVQRPCRRADCFLPVFAFHIQLYVRRRQKVMQKRNGDHFLLSCLFPSGAWKCGSRQSYCRPAGSPRRSDRRRLRHSLFCTLGSGLWR